jgi:hypothetical protein
MTLLIILGSLFILLAALNIPSVTGKQEPLNRFIAAFRGTPLLSLGRSIPYLDIRIPYA